MSDRYLRQSPLAHLHLDARALADTALADCGIEMTEVRHHDMLNLRGQTADAAFMAAVNKTLGMALPTEPNTVTSMRDGAHILWLGPNEWLISLPEDKAGGLAVKLNKSLKSIHCAVTPVGEGRTIIRIAGPHARDVLAKGCPLDLHPKVFGPGQCAQSLLGRGDMLLHCSQPGRDKTDIFDIYISRSFAEYTWTWLEDAAREYGIRVVTS
jgi:sarcosine oxidase, subunit gamma